VAKKARDTEFAILLYWRSSIELSQK